MAEIKLLPPRAQGEYGKRVLDWADHALQYLAGETATMPEPIAYRDGEVFFRFNFRPLIDPGAVMSGVPMAKLRQKQRKEVKRVAKWLLTQATAADRRALAELCARRGL